MTARFEGDSLLVCFELSASRALHILTLLPLQCCACCVCGCFCFFVALKVTFLVAFVLSTVSDVILLFDIKDSTDPILQALYTILKYTLIASAAILVLGFLVEFTQGYRIGSQVGQFNKDKEEGIIDEDDEIELESKCCDKFLRVVSDLLPIATLIVELYVLWIYLLFLQNTESLDFLRDNNKDATEWFLFICKIIDAGAGGLLVILIAVAYCCSKTVFAALWENATSDSDEAGMCCCMCYWMILWLIVMAGAVFRMIFVLALGGELGFISPIDPDVLFFIPNATISAANDACVLFCVTRNV